MHGGKINLSDRLNNQAQAIFTAGEDGKVKAWRTRDEPRHSGDQLQEADIERLRTKKKRESAADGDGKGRFKPY